jgi:hypothetical protein
LEIWKEIYQEDLAFWIIKPGSTLFKFPMLSVGHSGQFHGKEGDLTLPSQSRELRGPEHAYKLIS